jgi:hypothetical protein
MPSGAREWYELNENSKITEFVSQRHVISSSSLNGLVE